MNKNLITDDINKLLLLLLENGYLVDYKPAIIRDNLADNMLAITWVDAPHSLFNILYGEHATIPEYRHLIENRYYHGLLFDGAIIQFGCLFQNGEFIKHRFWYYPCPVKFSDDIITDFQTNEDVLLYFDDHLSKEAEQIQSCVKKTDFSNYRGHFRMVTPIRFDFDLKAQKKGHSASHMTLLNKECRIPVYGPISVGHFARFIFKNFYPSIWEKLSDLQQHRLTFINRSILQEETQDLYFDSSFR